MRKKFKKGDIIRGLPNNTYAITNDEMTKGIVEEIYDDTMDVRVLNHIFESNIGITCTVDNNDRYFELVKSKTIVIYQKGEEVIALDKLTGKKAVAKCSPEDEFNFLTGAKLAFARLIEHFKPLYNGKVVCIDNAGVNIGNYTVGKIYQFENGVLTTDCGHKFPGYGCNSIHSFDEWQKWTKSKFIEVVE